MDRWNLLSFAWWMQWWVGFVLSHPFCRERRKDGAPRGGEIEAVRCRALALQQKLEGLAGGLEALAGFVL